MGFKEVFDRTKVILVYDHLFPPSSLDDVRHHRIGNEFAEKYKIGNVYNHGEGVCHQIMIEDGHILPGEIVFGTDSHSVSYGALGCLGTGIGYTEMAGILGTGITWLKIVPTIKIIVNGAFPNGVYAKDLILKIISDIKADGANYKVMEFTGETIRKMSISSRITIANMSVECGAKAGIVEPDDKTIDFLKKLNLKYEYEIITSDKNAKYESVLEYDVSKLEPLVSVPSSVDKVISAKELERKKIKIHQAFLGSCTNGRVEDIEIAAKLLKNRAVHPDVRFIITPASKKVYL